MDAAAARPQGLPYRHLLLPSRRARQEKIGNVQRYDENDQDDRTQQHQEHGPNIAHQRFLQ
jgi:hypothetical protein